MKSSVFCDVTPCSPLKVNVDFQCSTLRYVPEDRTLLYLLLYKISECNGREFKGSISVFAKDIKIN
jgi:hypothetical protein